MARGHRGFYNLSREEASEAVPLAPPPWHNGPMNASTTTLANEPQTTETVVRDRRAIVDRRALQGELEAIIAADEAPMPPG